MLFDCLVDMKAKVKAIHFQYNQIDDKCIVSLGKYVQSNHNVEKISLESNKISDKGIEAIMEYIIGNCTLKKLLLNGNDGITKDSSSNLLEMAKSSCIINLQVSDLPLSNQVKDDIKQLLEIPVENRDIPLISNCKSAAKAARY